MRAPTRAASRHVLRLLAAAGCLAAADAPACDAVHDLEGFWAVEFERELSGRALIAELPDDAWLVDDAGGGELGLNDFGGLELGPEALAEVAEYDYTQELARENACVSPSAAFYMQAPFPMEIYQGTELIVLKMDYFGRYRVIFLDGRPQPPPDAPHTKSGHSVGRWEGETLVVDTTHLAAGTFMNNGLNHSDNIHMVERFRLSPDGNRLGLTQLYEDPAVFKRRAARYMAWTRVPGEYVYPYDCDPSYGR